MNHGPLDPQSPALPYELSAIDNRPSNLSSTSLISLNFRPYFRRVAPATSCGCLNSLPYHPPPPMLDPSGHYYPHNGHQCLAFATSSYDLTTAEQSGPRWHSHHITSNHPTRMSNRKNQVNTNVWQPCTSLKNPSRS